MWDVSTPIWRRYDIMLKSYDNFGAKSRSHKGIHTFIPQYFVGCNYSSGLIYTSYLIYLFPQKFVLPPVVIFFLGGMLLMYGRIIYVAQSQRRQISDMKKRFQSNPEECKKTDYRLTVMLAYVTGFLTLTYIPLVVVFIFGAHLNTVMYWDDYVPEELLVFAVFERLVFSCVFMNSLINPIIYHFKNPEFRRAFRQMCGARKVAAQDTSVTDTHRSTLATDIATTTNGGSFMDLPRA